MSDSWVERIITWETNYTKASILKYTPKLTASLNVVTLNIVFGNGVLWSCTADVWVSLVSHHTTVLDLQYISNSQYISNFCLVFCCDLVCWHLPISLRSCNKEIVIHDRYLHCIATVESKRLWSGIPLPKVYFKHFSEPRICLILLVWMYFYMPVVTVIELATSWRKLISPACVRKQTVSWFTWAMGMQRKWGTCISCPRAYRVAQNKILFKSYIYFYNG